MPRFLTDGDGRRLPPVQPSAHSAAPSSRSPDVAAAPALWRPWRVEEGRVMCCSFEETLAVFQNAPVSALVVGLLLAGPFAVSAQPSLGEAGAPPATNTAPAGSRQCRRSDSEPCRRAMSTRLVVRNPGVVDGRLRARRSTQRQLPAGATVAQVPARPRRPSRGDGGRYARLPPRRPRLQASGSRSASRRRRRRMTAPGNPGGIW